MRRTKLWLALLMLGACVPASPPPQLGYTPGAPVTVTEQQVRNSAFTVTRPAGWRLITSAAGEPPTVIFVSPDDTALVMISAEAIEDPPRPQVPAEVPLREAREMVGTIEVYAVGPQVGWAVARATLAEVVASLEASD